MFLKDPTVWTCHKFFLWFMSAIINKSSVKDYTADRNWQNSCLCVGSDAFIPRDRIIGFRGESDPCVFKVFGDALQCWMYYGLA